MRSVRTSWLTVKGPKGIDLICVSIQSSGSFWKKVELSGAMRRTNDALISGDGLFFTRAITSTGEPRVKASARERTWRSRPASSRALRDSASVQ